MKNSFENISEVNQQCLYLLGTRSEDDFEKVSSTSTVTLWLKRMPKGWIEKEYFVAQRTKRRLDNLNPIFFYGLDIEIARNVHENIILQFCPANLSEKADWISFHTCKMNQQWCVELGVDRLWYNDEPNGGGVEKQLIN